MFRDIQNNKDDLNKQVILAEFLTLILSVGETLPTSCFGKTFNLDSFTKLLINNYSFFRIYECGLCHKNIK